MTACEAFERQVAELARGAGAVDAAVAAHAQKCERCAARWAEEGELQSALRALRDASSNAAAPARVEALLLAHYRSRGSMSQTGDSAGRWKRPAIRWSLAAAAAGLLFTLWLWPAGQPVPPPQVAGKRIAPPTVDPNPPAAERVPRPIELPAVVGQRIPTPRLVASRRATSRPVVKSPAASPARDTEVVSDFYPLVMDAWTGEEPGQMVRVRLPRSAMRTVGLPVVEERAFERIQADVLLGRDGVPRAIRFVSTRIE